MSDIEVRTRLAPSPTGDPHVGTAYQALFSYVWARKNSGKFVLRIEDTDRERSSPASETAIIESLRWLGLDWDEGPDVGGPYGPYRQSERLDIYQDHVQLLVAEGHAYPCFCSRERLAELRNERQRSGAGSGYDRKCRDIPPEEAGRRIDAGEEFTVRMKVPLAGRCEFTDLLRGKIEKDWESIDDQVIMKADGYPTYHLAVVVDDHLMRISHIIRGEEWINSVPKHVLLYEFFGWETPVFCHLPLLRNKDKSKLSKRKNPVSIDWYRRTGILPEALLNFIGMMGWHLSDDREKFSVSDMIESFRLEDISLGGPVFDLDKLQWLNGKYIREDFTTDRLLDRLVDWGLNRDHFREILEICRGRMTSLSDWGDLTAHFFTEKLEYSRDQLLIKDMDGTETCRILQIILWELERMEGFTKDDIYTTFRELSEKLDMKMKLFTAPLYIAMSGKSVSTPLFDTMAILGSDVTRMRIKAAMEELGGLSGKQLEKLERSYALKDGEE
ncbi:MAG: glutamate--tRNA ligase [Candidatus Fermentibacteraceae bacterium]|nr:glutamate--tRNA ligase [Candidatus Fermentibacteraceae bacterium]MBN2608382.1 glutamate--tRNA ligase [Candidatus Fermentibacteraceae bacterium]